jgi:hypothetical protein
VHGLAELTLVIEDNNLIINLVSPTANLIGFEHKAKTLAEHMAVERAESILQKYDRLFVLNGGACLLTNHTTEFSGITENQHNQAEHDEHQHTEQDASDHHQAEHDEHQHTDKHGSQHASQQHNEHQTSEQRASEQLNTAASDHNEVGHDEVDHDAHQHIQQNSKHSEVVANYQYHCENIAQLTQLTVQVFEQFSSIEKINAMWITESNQASATLNANNNRIYLR